MAALHTLHRAGQGLRVLARGGAGWRTAVVAPLALVPILPQVPLLAALGCVDGRHGRDRQSTGCPGQPEGRALSKAPSRWWRDSGGEGTG